MSNTKPKKYKLVSITNIGLVGTAEIAHSSIKLKVAETHRDAVLLLAKRLVRVGQFIEVEVISGDNLVINNANESYIEALKGELLTKLNIKWGD